MLVESLGLNKGEHFFFYEVFCFLISSWRSRLRDLQEFFGAHLTAIGMPRMYILPIIHMKITIYR